MRFRHHALLAGLLAATGSLALAAAPAPRSDVDRLADLMVQMLPMGPVLDEAAAANPEWPLVGKADKVTPEQLACTRRELSSEGYRRTRRQDAEKYAKAHPTRLHAGVELMANGAARVFGQLVSAGIQKARDKDDTDLDMGKALAGVTNDEVLAFVTLTNDPAYADLREAIGIGEALSARGRSPDEAEQSGMQVGTTLTTRLMITAMGTCNVPPSAYL